MSHAVAEIEDGLKENLRNLAPVSQVPQDDECSCGTCRPLFQGESVCCGCCRIRWVRLPEVAFLMLMMFLALFNYSPSWFGSANTLVGVLFRGTYSGSAFFLMFFLYFPATIALTYYSVTRYFQCGRFRAFALIFAGVVTDIFAFPTFRMWSSTLWLEDAITAEFGASNPPNPTTRAVSFYDWMFGGSGSDLTAFEKLEFTYLENIEPKPGWGQPPLRCFRDFAGELKLDVYKPTQQDGQLAPIIFDIHGGGWTQGDKSDIQSGAYFLERGYGVVSPEYNFVCDGFHAYDMVGELTTALEYVREHAAEWGFDADRIFVVGGSAGGHLALMTSYTINSTSCGDWKSCGIKGVFSLYGVTTEAYSATQWPDNGMTYVMADVLEADPELIPELIKNAFPAYFATWPRGAVNPPPTMTLHGTYDSIVPYNDGVALHAALEEAGVKNLLITAHTFEHILNLGYSGVASQVHRFALERFLALTDV